jgi:hypothetical protein
VIGPLAAGLLTLDADPPTREALRVAAERALRAGVRLTLSEWNAMSEPEREAFEDAQAALAGGSSSSFVSPQGIDAAMQAALDRAEVSP